MRRWTQEEAETLERLVRNGALDAELAEHFDRPVSACKDKRQRLGLDCPRAPGRPRKHDYREIGALLDQGLPMLEIDRRLGLPPNTTQGINARGML